MIELLANLTVAIVVTFAVAGCVVIINKDFGG